MITEITEEDREQIRRFKEISDRRGIANPNKVTELYNRVLHRNEKPTRCAGCINGRIRKLYNELLQFEKEEAGKKNAEENKEN